ncbi:hypothetical protein WA158_002934 [Blastocystis sp. Blastoise]
MSLSITRSVFETLKTGEVVHKFIFSNGSMKITMLDFGAHIWDIQCPDKNGTLEGITQSCTTIEDQLTLNNYYGATIGRYGNRIAKGVYKIDGIEYHAPINNGDNALHGGIQGFDKHMWDTKVIMDNDQVGVEFSRVSADGEEGYPGEMHITVAYTLNLKNELSIDYKGTTTKPTIINMTNHTYWNLTGNCKDQIYDTELYINADKYLPVEDMIPINLGTPVKDTTFDFTTRRAMGPNVRASDGGGKPGIDHTYILNKEKEGELSLCAEAYEPVSGRHMTVYTTEPGVQLYTSNWIDKLPPWAPHYAFCLETHHAPNSPNVPEFPTTLLRPDQTYHTHTVYAFSW